MCMSVCVGAWACVSVWGCLCMHVMCVCLFACVHVCQYGGSHEIIVFSKIAPINRRHAYGVVRDVGLFGK